MVREGVRGILDIWLNVWFRLGSLLLLYICSLCIVNMPERLMKLIVTVTTAARRGRRSSGPARPPTASCPAMAELKLDSLDEETQVSLYSPAM